MLLDPWSFDFNKNFNLGNITDKQTRKDYILNLHFINGPSNT